MDGGDQLEHAYRLYVVWPVQDTSMERIKQATNTQKHLYSLLLPLRVCAMRKAERKKVIIDTDPGIGNRNPKSIKENSFLD